MAAKFKTELLDDERKFVGDNAQLIANEVVRPDKAKAQANLEAIAAGISIKSEAVRDRLRPLWLSSMRIVNPSWGKEAAL